MIEEAKHAPLPWRVANNPGGPGDQPAFPSVIDSSGKPHGEDIVTVPLGLSEVVKANAAFIVRACNAHYALVEALEILIPMAKGYAAEHPVGNNTGMIETAYAAIAQAEGRK